jgi:hypothetical protein
MTTRSHSQYLTAAEIEKLREGFRSGRAIADLAAEVDCSTRAVFKHFGKFRKAGLVRSSKPLPVAVVERPSRFCKSSFEL